jgi:glucose/mannose-6-phosphate isomerase
VPLIYGGGKIGEVAAARFKNQINENSKSPAFFNVLPEMCHNEMAGWGNVDGLRELNLVPVHLRHTYEHLRLAPRFDFNEALIDRHNLGVIGVRAQGETSLAQLFDLILVGDQTSLELAAMRGQDPGPIDVLTELKQQLGK